MRRFGVWLAVTACAIALPAAPQAPASPPGPAAPPSDYILLTVIMWHDQTMNLGEINKIQEGQGFWAKCPPEGI